MRKLTKNQCAVFEYLRERPNVKTSPTEIGNIVGGGRLMKGSGNTLILRHSSWASPICKALVAKGLIRRTNKGQYYYYECECPACSGMDEF